MTTFDAECTFRVLSPKDRNRNGLSLEFKNREKAIFSSLASFRRRRNGNSLEVFDKSSFYRINHFLQLRLLRFSSLEVVFSLWSILRKYPTWTLAYLSSLFLSARITQAALLGHSLILKAVRSS